MIDPALLAKVRTGTGFIAALDQSGGSTPGALKAYGVGADAFSNDDEMYGLIHAMRSRIITSPSFTGGKVLAAILFERTMDGEADGKPVPQALADRGVLPFLKVDKGLEDSADGVKLMKPMPDLDALLARAKAKGIVGTKMRSVIDEASPNGIAAVVEQQFAIAEQIIEFGLIPIVEPEVSITSATRAAAEDILLAELTKALDAQPEGHEVMLKLTIPLKPDLYAPLVAHPRVARVVALSGGFSRDEACVELTKNHGMIASFSRALLSDLRTDMSDDEFDATLGKAIDQICVASAS
ncbi:MAG: fructose bisphosphate aldolase [Pseudomonadota bacterium]